LLDLADEIRVGQAESVAGARTKELGVLLP
jgi:hypothetical protein